MADDGVPRVTYEPPFKLDIDHKEKLLGITITGTNGNEVTATFDLHDLIQIMANLSHCQHVLALAEAGHQLTFPFDPATVFDQSRPGYTFGSTDTIAQVLTSIDDTRGAVVMTVLGGSNRLSGYRMSPDKARKLGDMLLTAADRTPSPNRTIQ
jgi:hypothetical protein